MSKEKKFTPQSYVEGLAKGKLEGSICGNCETPHLPPRHICPVCGSRELEWKTFKGGGTVTGYTVVAVAPAFMVEKAPYKMVIVKLDDGPSITAILQADGDVKVGDRVTAAFQKEEDKTYLYFVPA